MGRPQSFWFALLFLLSAISRPALAWWVSVAGQSPRGHEEITWQGISRAQELLQAHHFTEENGQPFFPVPPRAADGFSNASFILMGNYSVDRPDDLSITSDEVMNIRKAFTQYYQLPLGANWHNTNDLQALHFMRQFDANEAWSSRYSCEKAKDAIVFSSTRAVANWTEVFNPEKSAAEKQKSRERALFWIGVSLHTIQDSFSPVHVEREVGPKTKIKQLCTYIKEFPGVCHHNEIDTHDNIWAFGTPPASLDTSVQASAGLIQLEAQAAAMATRDYLVKMGMQFMIGTKWVDRMTAIDTTYFRLIEFFHDAEPEGSGRFWCPISPVMVPDKSLFNFGEQVKVKFKEQVGLGPAAYLGMLRKEAEHVARPLSGPGAEPDDDFVSWYNIDGTSQEEGNVQFEAKGAGDWEIRLFNTAGEEKMVVGVTVKPGLKVPGVVSAGATFPMEFGADSRWPVNAFIALVPVGTADTAEASKQASVQFLKLNQMENETVTVTAPLASGNYEMRMFSAGGVVSGAALVARALVQVQ